MDKREFMQAAVLQVADHITAENAEQVINAVEGLYKAIEARCITDDDGWVEWDGGDKPDLPDDTVVHVKFRDGSKESDGTVGFWYGDGQEINNNWTHCVPSSVDIVAYRVVPQ